MKHSLTVFSKLLFLAGFCLVSSPGFAQQSNVSGLVSDSATGNPLPGATVGIKGTHEGAVTDQGGNFYLTISSGQVIVVSSVGYKPKEITYRGQPSLHIKLSGQSTALDQLVVVGYGTQKRSELSGAVSTLSEKVIDHAHTSNIGIALEGQLPGLRVTQSTGEPGTTPAIVFRGGTTFGGGGSPLVIVDGIIVPSIYAVNMNDVKSITVLKDAASTAIYGARAANGVILIKTKTGGKPKVTYEISITRNLPPENPVSYLTAPQYIHWNRYALRNRWLADKADGNTGAANNDMGQLSGGWGWAVSPGFTSPEGLYTTQLLSNSNRHLLMNPGWFVLTDPNPFNPSQIDTILYRNLSVKQREDMILQKQWSQDHYLNFSGGDDTAGFALGLGLTKEKGVIIGSDYQRMSMNFNGHVQIGERLKVNATISAYNIKQHLPYIDPYSNLIQRFIGVAPTVRYYNDTSGEVLPGPNDESLGNPAYWSKIVLKNTTQKRFMGGLHLTYNILPGLDFLASGSGYFLQTTNNSFTKAYQRGNGGSINDSRGASFDINKGIQYRYNAFLQYTKKYNGNELTILGGAEFYDLKNYAYSGSAQGAPTDFIPWLSASLPASVSNGNLLNPVFANSDLYAWDRLASLIGTATYSYKGKYFGTFNIRYDGTSRLSNNRYGWFPGISAGWNIQNEKFFRNGNISKYVTVLKPRISWGENGSITSIETYATAQVFSSTGVYNGHGGQYYPNYINPDLKWETSSTTNFGLDLGLIDNRIYLTADYFIRNVYDKIAGQPIAPTTGFNSYTTNLGQLQNRGLELSATAKIIIPHEYGGFSWQVGANFYTVKNYAIELPDNGLPGNRQSTQEVYDSKGNFMYVGGLTEGKRIGYDEVWAPLMDGIYRTQTEINKDANVYNAFLPYQNKRLKTLGDTRWHQVYHNDTISSRQFVYAGRTTPDITGGFTTTLNYKGFTLYTQFDYALNFIILNQVKMRGLSLVQGSQSSTTAILNTWTPENPDAPLPKVYWANQGRNFNTTAGSTVPFANFWEKGDYLSIRNVSLSYRMPDEILDALFHKRVTGLQLSVSGQNLHYFTSYDGYGKEVGGYDFGRYPLPVNYTFSAAVTF